MHLDPAHAPEAVEQSSDRDHEVSQDAGRAERHDRSAATLAVAFRVVGVLSSDVLGNAQTGAPRSAQQLVDAILAASPSLLSNPRNQRATQPIELVGYVGAN